MMEEIGEKRELTREERALAARADRGRAAWRRFGLRLRAVTPADIARYLLVGGALAAVGWLLLYAWSALVPFVIGAALAYALLPIVNGLDRVMPRKLAALLSVLAALAFLGLMAAVLIPMLARQFLRLVVVLPPVDEIRGYVQQLAPLLEGLPAQLRDPVSSSLDEAALMLRQTIVGFSDNLPHLLAGILLRLINVVGAILGLLVLPTWLLLVLADQREGTRTLNRILPVAIQRDFWAVARILDRSFRAFLQSQVTQGFVSGLLGYLVVYGLDAAGIVPVDYPLVTALFIGLMELVPELGPLVGVVVLGISGALISPATGLIAVLLYLLIHRLSAAYVETRSRRRVNEVHPAIMVVGAVALSEVGLVWVLISVPLLTAGRDLLIYAHGRLSDPPQPAGFIPGETAPAEKQATAPERVPLVYARAASEREVRR